MINHTLQNDVVHQLFEIASSIGFGKLGSSLYCPISTTFFPHVFFAPHLNDPISLCGHSRTIRPQDIDLGFHLSVFNQFFFLSTDPGICGDPVRFSNRILLEVQHIFEKEPGWQSFDIHFSELESWSARSTGYCGTGYEIFAHYGHNRSDSQQENVLEIAQLNLFEMSGDRIGLPCLLLVVGVDRLGCLRQDSCRSRLTTLQPGKLSVDADEDPEARDVRNAISIPSRQISEFLSSEISRYAVKQDGNITISMHKEDALAHFEDLAYASLLIEFSYIASCISPLKRSVLIENLRSFYKKVLKNLDGRTEYLLDIHVSESFYACLNERLREFLQKINGISKLESQEALDTTEIERFKVTKLISVFGGALEKIISSRHSYSEIKNLANAEIAVEEKTESYDVHQNELLYSLINIDMARLKSFFSQDDSRIREEAVRSSRYMPVLDGLVNDFPHNFGGQHLHLTELYNGCRSYLLAEDHLFTPKAERSLYGLVALNLVDAFSIFDCDDPRRIASYVYSLAHATSFKAPCDVPADINVLAILLRLAKILEMLDCAFALGKFSGSHDPLAIRPRLRTVEAHMRWAFPGDPAAEKTFQKLINRTPMDSPARQTLYAKLSKAA